MKSLNLSPLWETLYSVAPRGYEPRMRMIRLLVVAVVALAVFAGCRSGGGEGYYAMPWYDVYGKECGYTPSPGCNYNANGRKIFVREDPFYGHSPHFWCGIGYDPDTCSQALGWSWFSPSGILYDPWGYALNADSANASRDIIAEAGAEAQERVLSLGRDFAKKNALTEEVGIRIARVLHQMATLPGRLGRARTEADIADFTRRLYGVDYSRVISAARDYQAGDTRSLRELNAEVARNWGTSPEVTEQILRRWYE